MTVLGLKIRLRRAWSRLMCALFGHDLHTISRGRIVNGWYVSARRCSGCRKLVPFKRVAHPEF